MSSHAAGSSMLAPGSSVGSGVAVSGGSAVVLALGLPAPGDDVAVGAGAGVHAASSARITTDAAAPATRIAEPLRPARSGWRVRRREATGSMDPPGSIRVVPPRLATRARSGRATLRTVTGSIRQAARRSRRLFSTTKTLENAIAAPAIMGLSSPSAARGIAATL